LFRKKILSSKLFFWVGFAEFLSCDFGDGASCDFYGLLSCVLWWLLVVVLGLFYGSGVGEKY